MPRLAPETLTARPMQQNGTAAALTTFALFSFVVLAWGLNWVVMKIVVQEVSPLWAVAMRTALAAVVLAPALYATGQLIVPKRGDYPIILVISLFHMVAFAALMTAGLKYVSAGRSIVLGYTTPLWVAPAALIFLREPIPIRQMIGIAIGIAGLLYLFEPRAFDWHDSNAVVGNGLVLLAAICWSVSIVYTRAHRWIATPLQLVLWQTLLAAIVLTALAVCFEGTPNYHLSAKAMLALGYNGAVGTALGYWAMTVVNRRVPATTASLGVLATPVVGIGLASILLGETIDMVLLISSLTILIGISIGVKSRT